MESLPLATGPKHVPDGVGDRPLGGSGPAAFGAFRVPWLGQVFLEFPPQRPGHPEVVRFRLCGSLCHRAHLLSRMVMVAIPFSEGCVFVQGSQVSSRIESNTTVVISKTVWHHDSSDEGGRGATDGVSEDG